MADYLFYDIETRSQADLKKVGTYRYAENPHTEVLCAALALDDEPIEMWTPDRKLPKKYADHIRKGRLLVAHGAQFERQIHAHKLGPVHGWPLPKLEQFRCSQAQALALGLPPALENISEALGIKMEKDTVGKRVMMQMTKPRKARKGEDPDAVHWYDDEERTEKLQGYCVQDVEVTREAFNAMWSLTTSSAACDEEMLIWQMDQRINDRGFYVDPDLLLAMRRIITDAGADIDKQMIELTEGAVQTVNEVANIKKWLFDKCKVDTGSLSKGTIPDLIARADVPQLAKDVLELRLAGAQAAVKKVDAFLARRDNDGRVRGSFLYHSAGTGRWASRGAQVHNLKRLTTEDQDVITGAVDDLLTGDYHLIKTKYAKKITPLKMVGDNIRTVICAAPGNVLIGADFSGIEARVTAWLAGEARKLQVFRDYDDGNGPDPYVAAGADVFGLSGAEMVALKERDPADFKIKRQGGKGAELAFGFQGGVNAYVKFVPEGLFTHAQIDEFKVKWRKAHPNIQRMWFALNDASNDIAKKAALVARGLDIDIDPITVGRLTLEYDEGFMFIVLPSGRRIAYPGISRTKDYRERFQIQKPTDTDQPVGKMASYFMDNSSGRWHRVFSYGGLLTENVVQGVARDLLAAAMLRIEAAGFPITVHVHDEICCEVPKKSAAKVLKEFQRLMCILPEWAQGDDPEYALPVVAKGWISQRYVK
jgi:DNA polymerase